MLEKSTYLTNCLTFCKKGYTIVDPACSVNETAGLILDAQEESRIFGVKTTGRRTRAVAGRKMSMYDHKVNAEATVYYLAERNIYGSSRLGTTRDTINMYIPNQLPGYGVVGNRNYELNNHLGNVLAVISDIVYPLSEDSSTISSYEVGITQISDYSPFGVQLDGRTMDHVLHDAAAAVDTSAIETPSVAEIYKNEFDVPVATTSPYTGAPTTLDANLSNTYWTSSTGTFTNHNGASGTKAIAISSASADTAYLTLSVDVSSGYTLDINSYSFYHRSSSTGYANYMLVVNGIEIGSGSIYVATSGSTLHSTGVVSVLNAITGQTGTVQVVLKLFGGTHGSSGTFRMDNFTLNGYTQQLPSSGSSNSSAYVVSSGYRYGYQGSEMDNEVKGEGNFYTTEFRMLDSRLGRWLSIDPKVTAWASPYVSMANNPIMNNDILGDTIRFDGSATGDIQQNIERLKNESVLFNIIYTSLDASPILFTVSDGTNYFEESGTNANGMFRYHPGENFHEILLRPSNQEKTIAEEFFHAVQAIYYNEVLEDGKRGIQEIEAEANLFQVLVEGELKLPHLSFDASIFLADENFFRLLDENNFQINENSSQPLKEAWNGYLQDYENNSADGMGVDAYSGKQRELFPILVNVVLEVGGYTDGKKSINAPLDPFIVNPKK